MKMIHLLAAAVMIAAPAHAQSVAPRAAVSQIAQAVENRYFDISRGGKSLTSCGRKPRTDSMTP